jgi:hypothetical protein
MLKRYAVEVRPSPHSHDIRRAGWVNLQETIIVVLQPAK